MRSSGFKHAPAVLYAVAGGCSKASLVSQTRSLRQSRERWRGLWRCQNNPSARRAALVKNGGLVGGATAGERLQLRLLVVSPMRHQQGPLGGADRGGWRSRRPCRRRAPAPCCYGSSTMWCYDQGYGRTSYFKAEGGQKPPCHAFCSTRPPVPLPWSGRRPSRPGAAGPGTCRRRRARGKVNIQSWADADHDE